MRIILLLFGLGILLSCKEEKYEELVGYDDDENQEFMLFLDDLNSQYGKDNPAFKYSFVEMNYGIDALKDYEQKLKQNHYASLSPQSKFEYKQIQIGMQKISGNVKAWKLQQLSQYPVAEVIQYWLDQPVSHQLLAHVLIKEKEAFELLLPDSKDLLCEDWKSRFIADLQKQEAQLKNSNEKHLVIKQYIGNLKKAISNVNYTSDCALDSIFLELDVLQTRNQDCDSIVITEESKVFQVSEINKYLQKIGLLNSEKNQSRDSSLVSVNEAFLYLANFELMDEILKRRLENYQQHPMFKNSNIFANELFLVTMQYYIVLKSKLNNNQFKLCEVSNPIHRQAILDAQKWLLATEEAKLNLGDFYSEEWMFEVLMSKGNLDLNLILLAIDFEQKIKKYERNPTMQEH